jgi:hypothetical protein
LAFAVEPFGLEAGAFRGATACDSVDSVSSETSDDDVSVEAVDALSFSTNTFWF